LRKLFKPREYIAQGNRVVAFVRYEGRYKGTGKTFAADSTILWTVDSAKAVGFQEYTGTEAVEMSS
jgi:uncharacterized protein